MKRPTARLTHGRPFIQFTSPIPGLELHADTAVEEPAPGVVETVGSEFLLDRDPRSDRPDKPQRNAAR